MPAAAYDFVIEQSSDFNINFQYIDENGLGINLSNACVSLQLLDNNGSGYRYSCDACGCPNSSTASSGISNGAYSLLANQTGLISIFFPDATTSAFNFDTAQYDLDARTPNNGNYRIATGTITLVKKIVPGIFSCSSVIGGGQSGGTTGGGTVDPSGNPTSSNASQDLCFPDCLKIDSYSIIYNGSGINILDNSDNQDSINVYDSRNIEGIDIVINGLTHASVQDLTFILNPPTGDPILLASNNKIQNYKSNFGFVFTDKYSNYNINNVPNGGYAKIQDRTNITKYDNFDLKYNFSHLYSNPMPSGDWTLYLNDNDIGGTGILSSWQLIITYQPTEE
jgi:subtilisin-like proprotein convertase family protein